MSVLLCAIEFWSTTVLSSISFVICIIGLIKTNKKDNKFLIFIASIVFLILSFIMAAMSGRETLYYALTCIPAFVFPTAFALNYLLEGKKQGIVTFIIGIVVILTVFCNESNQLITRVIETHKGEDIEYNEEKIAKYVKERTEPNDEVIVLGNRAQINILSERTNTARYFYQTPIANIDENIANEFLEWLKQTEPQMMVSYVVKPAKEENNTYFIKNLLEYLEQVTKQGKYTQKRNLVKNITIYEKIK